VPSLLQIILLGIVQGAAELLPVSSSAHVIAAERLMRLDPSSPEMTYLMVMLHAGTMVAMVAYFWGAWRRSFFASMAVFRDFAARAALATAATALVGYPLQALVVRLVLHGRPGAQVEDLFSNLPLMAACLAAAGVLIVAAGLRTRPAGPEARAAAPSGDAIPTGAAIWIGAVQGVCLPFRGFSRSGATISTGMLVGVGRRAAEEFSFALAVILTPPVIAREAWRLYREHAPSAAGIDAVALAGPGLIGMASSFVAGLVALRWLSRWLENGRWHYFGFYCFAAAAGVCALAEMGF
jgi:undecaprenyl-diphosphatase